MAAGLRNRETIAITSTITSTIFWGRWSYSYSYSYSYS
jgi:hypothetical protein